MKMSTQLPALAALPLGKQTSVPIDCIGVGWALKAVWTLWRKSLSLTGNGTSVFQVVIESLHQLTYFDSFIMKGKAIPVTCRGDP
jgi:hypothetical protein